MITKLTSAKTVIAKVIADLDLSEKDVKISDFREWIGEAVEKIGALPQYINKVTGQDGVPVTILSGHQAALPCDLHQLHQVAYSYSENGPWYPMRKATGSFSVWGPSDEAKQHKKTSNCNCTDDDDEWAVPLCADPEYDWVVLDNTVHNVKPGLHELWSVLTDMHTFAAPTGHGPIEDLQYSIKPGYVMCNVPNGFLKLSYSAIPTDPDGYPMVPDLTSYTEAIYWYVTMKFLYPRLLRGQIKREDYYDIRRSWAFYSGQAYADALMPNEDEMESLKNNWNKLVPELNDHNSFYAHTGERQRIYNANRI